MSLMLRDILVIMISIDEYIKREKMKEIFDSLSDEDKRQYFLLSQMSIQHKEIMNDMNKQNRDLELLCKKAKTSNFAYNFLANISADAVWELFIRICRKIK